MLPIVRAFAADIAVKAVDFSTHEEKIELKRPLDESNCTPRQTAAKQSSHLRRVAAPVAPRPYPGTDNPTRVPNFVSGSSSGTAKPAPDAQQRTSCLSCSNRKQIDAPGLEPEARNRPSQGRHVKRGRRCAIFDVPVRPLNSLPSRQGS